MQTKLDVVSDLRFSWRSGFRWWVSGFLRLVV